jgi:hypothetical protein
MPLMSFAASVLLAAAAVSTGGTPSCDRACLEGMADTYLQAMTTHDVTALPLAEGARFAENGQELAVGDGSFQTVTGLGKYRNYFADPATGNVGVITTVTEHGDAAHGRKAIFDLRLRVVDGQIAEIETMLIRDAGGFDRYEAIGTPETIWSEIVPPEQRLSREDMVRTVNRYFSGMVHNDGRGDYTFFHPGCNRLEHALPTTNLKTREAYGHSTDTDFRSMDCRGQFGMGLLGFVTDMRDRRFLVVDEERQTLLALVILDHNGTKRELPLSTGNSFVLPIYFGVPRGLQVIEGFKLVDGMLYRIEMTLIETPYGSKAPWPDAPDVAVIP